MITTEHLHRFFIALFAAATYFVSVVSVGALSRPLAPADAFPAVLVAIVGSGLMLAFITRDIQPHWPSSGFATIAAMLAVVAGYYWIYHWNADDWVAPVDASFFAMFAAIVAGGLAGYGSDMKLELLRMAWELLLPAAHLCDTLSMLLGKRYTGAAPFGPLVAAQSPCILSQTPSVVECAQ